jgi:hypothetical protein
MPGASALPDRINSACRLALRNGASRSRVVARFFVDACDMIFQRPVKILIHAVGQFDFPNE